jgi:nucleoside-diphosphate-sugar epimerase
MSRVLLTGATGFIGRALLPVLVEHDHDVVAISRRPPPADLMGRARWWRADLAGSEPLPDELFDGVAAVVHLAGLAHAGGARDRATVDRHRAINAAAPLRLAQAAAKRGVRRFLFVSTATVHGVTSPAASCREDQLLAPVGPYARAKAEGEAALRHFAASGAIELVIVRPPLVYGPGVGGNFRELIGWAASGWPFPAARPAGRRHMIGLANLCDFLMLAMTHPNAANQTFLIGEDDGAPVEEMFRVLSRALGRGPFIVALPRSLLAAAFMLIGQGASFQRLYGDFIVDWRKARELLGWRPVVDRDAEIARTIVAFRAQRRGP